MEFTCSQHGSTVKFGCQECFQCSLGVRNAFNACKLEINAYKLEFPSLADVARKRIAIRSETMSSAHTNTGHSPAEYSGMEIPKVILGEEFWQTPTKCEFPDHIDSEAEVNGLLVLLLKDIVNALGLKPHLKAIVDVPIMDTAPDVAITTFQNKILIGTVEGKKPARGKNEHDAIYGSGTAVAGEVFEQLYLSCMQNDTFAVGLLSTFNSFCLVSTENLSEYTLSSKDALDFLNKTAKEIASTTPDKLKTLVEAKRKSGKNKAKRPKVKGTKAPPKGEGAKKGRVAVAILKHKAERKYFATKEVSFGENEEQNREVIKLLATYVLLCVDVQRKRPCQPLDLTKSNVECLTRYLIAGKEKFAFQQICLPEGIFFNLLPQKSETHYHAIRQLGYGWNGVSCFACTNSCAPCVIKFFRNRCDLDETFLAAKKEAYWWNHLYGELGFNEDVVKAYKSPRILLVMPFLRTPCDFSERKKLVAGKKEDSLLYKALKHLATKKCIHKEVFWHHIGLVGTPASMDDLDSQNGGMNCLPKRSQRVEGNVIPETAVFCDLAHVETCVEKEKLSKWVEECFQRMKDRMGEAANTPPQVLLKEQDKEVQQ